MEALAVVSQKLMGQQICCSCPYTFLLSIIFSVAEAGSSVNMASSLPELEELTSSLEETLEGQTYFYFISLLSKTCHQ